MLCSVSVWHALDRSGKGPITEAEDGPRLRQSFPTGGGYGLGWVTLSASLPQAPQDTCAPLWGLS